MNKAKLLLVLAFLTVCAAGAVAGMAFDRHVRAPSGRHGGLSGVLNLTPDQQQKMKEIWSPVQKLREDRFRARHELGQQRDQAVLDLLTPEQKAQYDQIQQRFREQVAVQENQMQQAVHDAEGQTREMLTPAQQARYDELRSHMNQMRMNPGGPRGGPFPGFPRHRDHSHPTTAPSSNVSQPA